MGAQLPAIWRSVPSRAMRVVSLARSPAASSRVIRRTGFATASRLWALTMRNTSPTGLPAASVLVQPVMISAAALRLTTAPAMSQAITPSAMERSVAERRSALSRSSCSACGCGRSGSAGSPGSGLLPPGPPVAGFSADGLRLLVVIQAPNGREVTTVHRMSLPAEGAFVTARCVRRGAAAVSPAL